jgi:hypothetical protein
LSVSKLCKDKPGMKRFSVINQIMKLNSFIPEPTVFILETSLKRSCVTVCMYLFTCTSFTYTLRWSNSYCTENVGDCQTVTMTYTPIISFIWKFINLKKSSSICHDFTRLLLLLRDSQYPANNIRRSALFLNILMF